MLDRLLDNAVMKYSAPQKKDGCPDPPWDQIQAPKV